MQFIDNRKLHIEDNLWLKGLSKKLDPSILLKMGNKSELYEDYPMMYTYIKGVTGANFRAVEEAKNMKTISETSLLKQVLKEIILENDKWEIWREIASEALETKKALDIAQNMLNAGFPPETIASLTGLDLETVKTLPSTATA
ncbi:MAG: hypothetical protein FWG77_08610 [Treponema sp.]|nr:hypothetical protein [Treponema sp.]